MYTGRQLDFFKEIKRSTLREVLVSLKHGFIQCEWPHCRLCLSRFECGFCCHETQSAGTMMIHLTEYHGMTPIAYFESIHYKVRVLHEATD